MIDLTRCIALGTATWDGDDIIYARMALPTLAEDVQRLRDEVRVLDQQVVGMNEADLALRARIEALHRPVDRPTSEHWACDPDECNRAGEGELVSSCWECNGDWPCATRRAITGEA